MYVFYERCLTFRTLIIMGKCTICHVFPTGIGHTFQIHTLSSELHKSFQPKAYQCVLGINIFLVDLPRSQAKSLASWCMSSSLIITFNSIFFGSWSFSRSRFNFEIRSLAFDSLLKKFAPKYPAKRFRQGGSGWWWKGQEGTCWEWSGRRGNGVGDVPTYKFKLAKQCRKD